MCECVSERARACAQMTRQIAAPTHWQNLLSVRQSRRPPACDKMPGAGGSCEAGGGGGLWNRLRPRASIPGPVPRRPSLQQRPIIQKHTRAWWPIAYRGDSSHKVRKVICERNTTHTLFSTHVLRNITNIYSIYISHTNTRVHTFISVDQEEHSGDLSLTHTKKRMRKVFTQRMSRHHEHSWIRYQKSLFM